MALLSRVFVILAIIVALAYAAVQPQPLDITPWADRTVMLITAHPDDIEVLPVVQAV